MRSSSVVASASALLVSLLATPAAAQLHTECNPLEKDCKPNPALATAHTFNFNTTPPSGVFKTEAGTVDYTSKDGAAFTIPKKGYSPTIKSNFYFFFGKTEVIMKPATGRGIVSSIVWSSDVLDEVDWEFLGGNETVAETNYFGKGRQDFHNAIYHPVDGGVFNDYHNYTTVWTKEKIDWYIDEKHVRTLLPKDANNTDNYPQTPMMLSLGIWAGGDPDQPKGTIEWAQGETDYNEGPFTMYVKSCRVEDFSKGKEYVYGDRSGKWESIKIVEPEANSTAVENINRPPPEPEKSLSEKWDDLPQGAKSGVYVGAVAVGAGAFIALLVYYLRQRKRGQREAAAREAEAEKERLELEQFRKEGRNPDALDYEGVEYNAAAMGKGPNVDTYQMPSASRSNSLTSNHDVPVSQNAWDPTSSAPLLSSPTGGAPTHSMSTPDAQMRSGAGSDGFEPTRTGSPGALDRSYSAGPYSGNDFGSPAQGAHR